MKPAKLPVFDPSSGENVFAWIVRTAPQVRVARQGQALIERLRREADARAARQPAQPPTTP